MKVKYTPRLEHANGDKFNLNGWLSSVLKGQDIDAWKRDCGDSWKQALGKWVKESLQTTIGNLDVVMIAESVGEHSTPAPKNDCLGLSWEQIERMQGGKLNRDNP